MVVRDDIWAGDTCLVCQSKHFNETERINHENTAQHTTKIVVFDFLMKKLQIRTPSNVDSTLFDRYSRANSAVAGLDCVCELKFSWAKTRFWICTVCYECGVSLDSADGHIYSSQHKRNYLVMHHPDKYNELIAREKNCFAEDIEYIEYQTIRTLLYDAKCLSPPDVYILTECSRQWVHKHLGVEDMPCSSEYLLEPISDFHELVQCMTCGENFFAYEDPEQLQQAWFVHLSSNRHQQCQQMHTILNEVNSSTKEGLPQYCHEKNDIGFNEFLGACYGPTCGFEFLVDFTDGKECFCTLCFCVIKKHEATEHFSCEYHIERYARHFNPSKLLNAEYMKSDERHAILVEAVIQHKTSSTNHRVCKGVVPKLLKLLAFESKRKFSTESVEELTIGRAKGIWCKDCTQYIQIKDKESWRDHLLEEEHFDFCTKRALYHLDDKNLVSNSSNLPTFRKGSQGWTEKFCGSIGCTVVTQDHCYYGLQYVVRDELSRASVCLCCHFVVSYEDDDIMSTHVRSLDHLLRIVHLTNKKFLGVLWNSDSVEKQKEYLLDYLKHCKLDVVVDTPIVYDPVSTLNANCYGRVSRWMLDLSKLPPETREISLASLKLEDLAKDKVPFNVAMRSANIEIRHIESSIVLFCQECNQAFSCSMDNIREKFAEHIFSQSHWNRQQSLRENRIDENKRLLGQMSSFVVNPFLQTNEKKVTWKWNDSRRAYEFVYAQLGLSDIIERRNFKTKRDLYCLLCAESFKAGKFELEHHIRSLAHIFYYVNNYRSEVIPEIEAAMLEKNESVTIKHKNIRRLLAKALKDLEKEKGEISVYDLSMTFCELPEVRNIISSEGQSVISPTKLLIDSVHSNNEENESLAIYTHELEDTTPAELQQRLVYLISKTGTDDSDLDYVKRKIITATLIGESSSDKIIAGRSSAISNTLIDVSSTSSLSSSTANENSTASSFKNVNVSRSMRNNSKNALSPCSCSPPLMSPSPEHPPIIKTTQQLRQYSDVIKRVYLSRSELNNINSRKSNDSSSVRTFGTRPHSRNRSRSRSPTNRNGHRSSSHYRSSTNSDSRNSTHSRRDSRSRTRDDESHRLSKRSSDSPKDKTESQTRSTKIKFNLPDTLNSETLPSPLEYRIRNAPIDISRISRNSIDPVDLHTEDTNKSNKSLNSGKSSTLVNLQLQKALDKAHAKAVEEFLLKTSTSGQAKVTTPSTITSSMASATVASHSMSQHPGGMFPGMMPPPIAGFPMPPFGAIPPFPPGPLGMAPPFMPFSGMSFSESSRAPSADVVMRAKMELYQRDLANVKTVADLIDYMWNQGFDKISTTEEPLLFNMVVKKRKGVIGCNMLYHILCYEHPELETFYCGMCNHWTTVSEMFTHLCTPLHRLNYMFRNYKVYHRRALEEKDAVIRAQFLEKMAEQIRELEGSGQCSNRMRCLLNEEAITRIWPDVINNIDHSWKIHDINMDILKTEPDRAAEIHSEHSATPLSGMPYFTSLDGESQMDIERNAAVNDILHKYRLDSRFKDVRSNKLKSIVDEDRKSSRNEKKDSDKKESRISRDHRTGERSPPQSRKRKERSRSRSPRRRRSRSPVRRHQKDSPATPDRKRRRSRSREKVSRVESRNSKTPPATSGELAKKKSETWDEKAAAFLDRIGNRKEAARLYFSALDDKNGPNDELLPPATASVDSTFGGKHCPPSADSYVLSMSSASGNNKSLDDRIRVTMSRDMNKSNRANVASEIAAELSKMDKESISDRLSKDHRSQKNRFEPANRASKVDLVNEKAEIRRTIGVIVELQSIYETEKRITGEILFKVCEDMGIAAKDALVNTLLRETAQMYGLDLATAYEEWITRKLMEAQQQNQRQIEHQTQNTFKDGISSELMDILRKVNTVAQSSTQTPQSKTSLPFKNSTKNSGFSRKPYEPELNTNMNFVYTGDDFKGENNGMNQCGNNRGDNRNEIDSTINRLTYAFGKQKNAIETQSDDMIGPGQDFQRFSDEDSDEYEKSLAAEEAGLEQQRVILQNLAEANGLRPEIASAAAAAAIQQQRQAIDKKRKKRAKAKAKNQTSEGKATVPNSNLEPLMTRNFGSTMFSESGSGGCRWNTNNNNVTDGTPPVATSLQSYQPPNTTSTFTSSTRMDPTNGQRPNINLPFDVGRVVQSFTGGNANLLSNTSGLQFKSNEMRPPPLSSITSGVHPPFSAVSTPATTLSAAVSYSASSQQSAFKQQQQVNNTMQRAFVQQDTVYQRGTTHSRNESGLKPPPVIRKTPTTSNAPYVNANVINIASQVGDDWSSMNSYINNLLKNPKPGGPNK